MSLPWVKQVIISRGRSHLITSHRVVRNATVVVPDDEIDDYKGRVDADRLVAIPSKIHGCPNVRNWVRDNFEEECIVIFDDDIKRLVCVAGPQFRVCSPQEADELVDSTAICAKDAGASVFGWNNFYSDVRKYVPHTPIRLDSWVGGSIGLIGDDLRWDSELLSRGDDIDLCLQGLLKDRITWLDQRFGFEANRENNVGGNARYRTVDRVEYEKAHMIKKWGKHVSFHQRKTTIRTSIHVDRKQTIYL